MPKILIVDDSNMLRDMVRYALNDGGYSDVVEAANGLEGLEKAKATAFDLIITDINMPEMNGIQLVQELRRIPTYARKPILVLTTEASDDMKQQGRAVGATGWIVKPFVPEQLLKAIGMVLARAQQ